MKKRIRWTEISFFAISYTHFKKITFINYSDDNSFLQAIELDKTEKNNFRHGFTQKQHSQFCAYAQKLLDFFSLIIRVT